MVPGDAAAEVVIVAVALNEVVAVDLMEVAGVSTQGTVQVVVDAVVT